MIEDRTVPVPASGGLRLLHLIATPRGLASHTGRISSSLLEALRAEDEALEVSTLDLFRADLPCAAGRAIEARYRRAEGEAPDDEALHAWIWIERAIEQFLAADVYLFTIPTWNLGIPYVLKYYIDAIVQPGYLFRYTADGQVEPLVHGKKMLVVMSSGSDDAPDDRHPFDFVEPYLRAIFGFVGITDITFVRASGMDVSPDVKKAGQKAAIAAASELARSGAWRPERLERAAQEAGIAPALVA